MSTLQATSNDRLGPLAARTSRVALVVALIAVSVGLWLGHARGDGFRRFQRRGLLQVRDEAYLMGWLLNLKRLATVLPALA
jgi:hypothetical protein